jgi:hypothetical protein
VECKNVCERMQLALSSDLFDEIRFHGSFVPKTLIIRSLSYKSNFSLKETKLQSNSVITITVITNSRTNKILGNFWFQMVTLLQKASRL